MSQEMPPSFAASYFNCPYISEFVPPVL